MRAEYSVPTSVPTDPTGSSAISSSKMPLAPSFAAIFFQPPDDYLCFSLRRERKGILARGIEDGNLLILVRRRLQIELHLVRQNGRARFAYQHVRADARG